jgi:hypothetical protein
MSHLYPMNRTNYIFVDFENIHEVDLDLVADKSIVVILVLGERHKRLPVELVKKLLKYPAQVRLVETGRTGRNALDFVLAYLLGVQSVTDPEGSFHILSKDKGFDALIQHLKKNDILADRHESFARIPALLDRSLPAVATKARMGSGRRPEGGRKPVTLPSLDGWVKVMARRFETNKTNRPKRKKTLLSHIHTHFGKRLSESELQGILDSLIAGNVIEITPAGKVVYKI